jgi:hypothetical protein
MYVRMYVCICVYICIYVCIYVCVYVYMYVGGNEKINKAESKIYSFGIPPLIYIGMTQVKNSVYLPLYLFFPTIQNTLKWVSITSLHGGPDSSVVSCSV